MMMVLIDWRKEVLYLFLSLLLMELTRTTQGNRIRVTTFDMTKSLTGSAPTILKTARTNSIIRCTVLCVDHNVCEAVNYDETTKQCDLLAYAIFYPALSNSAVTFSMVTEVPKCAISDPRIKLCLLNSVGRISYVCDNEWIVIQNRHNLDVSFTQNYQSYIDGFGDISGDFWWGLELLHILTSTRPYKLRVEMEKISDGSFYYQEYSSFEVTSASDGYKLSVSGTSGNAGDGLAQHNGMKFTTYDHDGDARTTGNCADFFPGGWWYYECFGSSGSGANPNGLPQSCSGNRHRECILWIPLEPTDSTRVQGMRKIRMMMQ